MEGEQQDGVKGVVGETASASNVMVKEHKRRKVEGWKGLQRFTRVVEVAGCG